MSDNGADNRFGRALYRAATARYHAIETRYGGALFRSRLEAHWAAFFDLLAWRWEYEPLDLNGYIPDFVLLLHEPTLVEVKPYWSCDELMSAATKIDAAGWDKEALIVGGSWSTNFDEAKYDGFDCPALGVLREYDDWALAQWFDCACGRPSFLHAVQSHRCRVNGCHDGDHHIKWSRVDLSTRWREAGTAVRWEPSKRR